MILSEDERKNKENDLKSGRKYKQRKKERTCLSLNEYHYLK